MSEAATTSTQLIIDPGDAGERLDRVLARRCPEYSRTVIQRWIAEGRVEQAGEIASRKTKALADAEVVLYPAPPEQPNAEPQAIPIDIIFEDSHLIVIDKQAGLVVHPGPGHPDGTLVNAVLHHAQLSGGTDPLRPGIVHRLDKDTSGVMVVAKTPEAHERLVEMFQAHALERAYLALAVGHTADTRVYDTLHGRHPVHRKKFTSKTDRGRPAITRLQTLERLHGASLLRCELQTGRTHQIRVHLADDGHPLLGDPLYGKSLRDPILSQIASALGRQALHATLLAFAHPLTGEPLRFERPPPADFQQALDALREAS